MVSVKHTVAVEPVPYPWLADAVTVIRTLVEESRADEQGLVLPDGQVARDIRLTRGRHLLPGSVYVIEDEADDGKAKADTDGSGEDKKAVDARDTVQITVREWDHRRAVRLELAVAEDDMTIELDGTLKSPDRPAEVEITGRTQGGAAPRTLFDMAGRARVRLDDWWPAADTGRASASAPASARLDHRWIRADARAVPRPSRDDGRWDIHVIVSLRGRRLLRPVAAVLLAFAALGIRRSLVRTLDGLAAQWNDRVPHLVAMNADQLREALLSSQRGENDRRTTGPPGTD
ncbi:hypothetical protein ACF09J_11990 [Streptomyces sp. NPDC014889]|uniref:hypothetical protein n=1 Tax=Streptomyces sp. NPDC014889 TaxID=3364928 RepID=UPI0036FD5962